MNKHTLPITRKDFYSWGGLSNPSLYRKANSRGTWLYYRAIDRAEYYG